jgi:hypothetical protein
MYPLGQNMFEPNEESLVLEIVRGFFDIPSEVMMKIGDQFKMLLFGPQTGSEEEAVAKLKDALKDMPKEHVLMAGMFVSGLLRCNLAQQVEQQYQQAKAEGKIEPDCGCD